MNTTNSISPASPERFNKQMVRDHVIPLDLDHSSDMPNDETIAAMKEAESIIARGRTGHSFKSAEEMMAFIEREIDD